MRPGRPGGVWGSRRISGSARLVAEAVERAAGRQALHAAWLAFKHPVTESSLEFRSEWPADLCLALELAAGGSVTVAPDEALRYLLFFNRDG